MDNKLLCVIDLFNYTHFAKMYIDTNSNECAMCKYEDFSTVLSNLVKQYDIKKIIIANCSKLEPFMFPLIVKANLDEDVIIEYI